MAKNVSGRHAAGSRLPPVSKGHLLGALLVVGIASLCVGLLPSRRVFPSLEGEPELQKW